MQVISYISSILDMETPLARMRLLSVKGNKAARGGIVPATIRIEKDPRLDFMAKIVAQIQISIKAKRANLPEGVTRVSRYSAKIS